MSTRGVARELFQSCFDAPECVTHRLPNLTVGLMVLSEALYLVELLEQLLLLLRECIVGLVCRRLVCGLLRGSCLISVVARGL